MKKSIFNVSTALGLILLTQAAYAMDEQEKPSHVYHMYHDNEETYFEASEEYASHPALTPLQKDGEEGLLAFVPREVKSHIVGGLSKDWTPTGHTILSLRDYLTISRINKEFYDIAHGIEEIKLPYGFRSDKYTDPMYDANIILPISMPSAFLQSFTKLTHLDLNNNIVVTDDCLEQLAPSCTTLTCMDLSSNKQLSDRNVALFTTLKVLNLGWECEVTGQVLASLTGLEELDLCANKTVEDSDLAPVTGLKKLNISCTSLITGKGLPPLTNLQKLSVSDNWNFTLEEISSLPIKHLSLRKDSPLCGSGLEKLPCLTTLSIESMGWMNHPNAPQPDFYNTLKAKGVKIEDGMFGEKVDLPGEDIHTEQFENQPL